MPAPVIKTDTYLAFRERDVVRSGHFEDACLRTETHLNCGSINCARVESEKHGWVWWFFDRDAPRPTGVPERRYIRAIIDLIAGD